MHSITCMYVCLFVCLLARLKNHASAIDVSNNSEFVMQNAAAVGTLQGKDDTYAQKNKLAEFLCNKLCLMMSEACQVAEWTDSIVLSLMSAHSQL